MTILMKKTRLLVFSRLLEKTSNLVFIIIILLFSERKCIMLKIFKVQSEKRKIQQLKNVICHCFLVPCDTANFDIDPISSKYMSSIANTNSYTFNLLKQHMWGKVKPCFIIYEMNHRQIEHFDDHLHHLFGIKTNYCICQPQ